MSGSGISWAICQSAPCSTPAPHHSVFTGRMPFLPPNQQCQSTEGTQSTVSVQLLTLTASSSERLLTVRWSSLRPSVCLSRRSIAAATCSWFAAARMPAADIDRYLPPALQRAGSVNAVIRGGSTQTCVCRYSFSRRSVAVLTDLLLLLLPGDGGDA